MANTILDNGIVIPEKGINSWYEEIANNYTLIDTHLGDADKHLNQEEKTKIDNLSNVASTGDYNDLNNKPTIPSKVSELINDVNYIIGVSWEEIDSKPLVYTPDTHTHVMSDITDLDIPTKTSDLDNDCDYTTTSYVDTKVANLVSSAPETLDTLNELASALGNDPNFATTVATQIGTKANSSDLSAVATSGSYNDLSDKPVIPDTTSFYTKTETDKLLATKTNDSDLSAVAKSGSYTDLINTPDIPDISNFYTKAQTDELLISKANSSEVYTKTEVDNLISGGATVDLSNYYTKSEVDNLLSNISVNSITNEEIEEICVL